MNFYVVFGSYVVLTDLLLDIYFNISVDHIITASIQVLFSVMNM